MSQAPGIMDKSGRSKRCWATGALSTSTGTSAGSIGCASMPRILNPSPAHLLRHPRCNDHRESGVRVALKQPAINRTKARHIAVDAVIVIGSVAVPLLLAGGLLLVG